MVNVIIYLKKEHNAKELLECFLSEKLIASASIDENNISYKLENTSFSEEVFSVITAQSKSLLFNEIIKAVEAKIGELKIKRLQKELFELRTNMSSKIKNVKMDGLIKID